VIRPLLFDPDHRVGREPIVPVDDVVMTVSVLVLEEVPDE